MAIRISMISGWEAQVMTRSVDPALTRLLHDMADDARRYAPVDTGALQAGIDIEPSVMGEGALVSHRDVPGDDPSVPVFVELGTSDSPAQPFMRPAAYQRRSI